MAKIPETVLEAWQQRQDLYVFSTVSSDGIPNAVYVIWAKPLDDQSFLIVNNRFHKTMANIESGSTGSLLFITQNKESFQLKGKLEYHTEGAIYEDMKKWLDPAFPGLGAVVLKVEEVYAGAQSLLNT